MRAAPRIPEPVEGPGPRAGMRALPVLEDLGAVLVPELAESLLTELPDVEEGAPLRRLAGRHRVGREVVAGLEIVAQRRREEPAMPARAPPAPRHGRALRSGRARADRRA